MPALNFKATDYAQVKSWEPLPEGWYLCVIEDSEERQTKAGTGSYYNLKFNVVQKEGNGRVFWTMLNINNPNPKAVEIAKGQLHEIMRAIGLEEIKDTVQLHNKPIMVKLKVVHDDWKNEDVNKPVGYKARNPSVDLVAKHEEPKPAAKPSAAAQELENNIAKVFDGKVEKDDVPF